MPPSANGSVGYMSSHKNRIVSMTEPCVLKAVTGDIPVNCDGFGQTRYTQYCFFKKIQF